MSNVDWYRRRLGTRPTPQAPRFVIGADGRAQPVRDERADPAPGRPWQDQLRPGEVPVGQTDVTEAIRLWRGSRNAHAAGVHDSRCPECGSGNYMAEVTANVAPGQGGEQGKRSIGFCMACGYRPGRGAPTIQPPAGVRYGSGDIPVEQARSAPSAAAFTGRFQVIGRVG